ncbi:MAG TPA: hypothetical protein VNF73_08975 [Candidatus Saccharimonadales bacterium]|nr:hypothetical protein [Candidatus Saccharimonadales bacterium]
MRADTEYLTTQDLADRWRLSAWTIRDYARRGLISGVVRAGRQFRFTPEASLDLQTPVAAGQASTSDGLSSFFDDFTRQLARTGRR